jgi:hypothetical protein
MAFDHAHLLPRLDGACSALAQVISQIDKSALEMRGDKTHWAVAAGIMR